MPLKVVVVAVFGGRAGPCRSCVYAAGAAGVDATVEMPGDDLSWLPRLLKRLGAPAEVHLVHALSLRGLYFMVRYRTGKLPLVLVDGRRIEPGELRRLLQA
ncbi:hypothetical protein [Pyrobaculum neutrophilum]|uniref:Glutaredoxin n=1 Tax=Pyrobaculum neutrophilum (strain DSM 2338 / JCM 9278 / NBRC 100436 / V24Sta) TaxID=444157 RepID=B1YC88_PYRNV|nr:hypothetical protein [Pyrobaculum neutrophilum]ACB39401.1 conserved hypothetical protein [Pyrobaculum neutrophilum V24Sta]